MARKEGMAAKGSTRKKMELSASRLKRTRGARLNSFNATAAGLVQIMPSRLVHFAGDGEAKFDLRHRITASQFA
jgi:hypothetical protein